MVFVVVLALFDGLDAEIRARLRALWPDITVHIVGYNPTTEEGLAAFLRRIESVPQVKAVSPFVYGNGEVRRRTAVRDAQKYVICGEHIGFYGIDFERERRVTAIARLLQYPGNPFAANRGADAASPPVIVDARLFGRKYDEAPPGEIDWGVLDRGDELQLTYLTNDFTAEKALVIVADVVKSDLGSDSHAIYVPIESARRLRHMPPNSIHGVRVALASLDRKTVAEAKRNIAAVMDEVAGGKKYGIHEREEEMSAVMADLYVYRRIMAVILFMLIIVTAFTVAAVLLMTAMEKTHDIGILRAMGASGGGVAAAFLGYCAATGLLGAAAGLAAARAVLAEIDVVEAGFYAVTGFSRPAELELERVPWLVDWPTVLFAAAVAVALGLVSSTLAAVRAARLAPVEAIRHA